MSGSSIYKEFISVTEGFKMEEEKKPEAPKPVAALEDDVPLEDPTQRRRKTSIKEQTEIFENVVASIGADGRADFMTQEIQLSPEEEEEKQALLNRLFMEEDRVQGKLGFSTVLTVIKEIGGFFPVFLILLSVTCLMITNFLSDYFHLEWAGVAADAQFVPTST